MSSAGGRPSWQKMVSVGTSIVPPGHRPPPEATPDTSSTATTSQVTASHHDFAVSLDTGAGRGRRLIHAHLRSLQRRDSRLQQYAAFCRSESSPEIKQPELAAGQRAGFSKPLPDR